MTHRGMNSASVHRALCGAATAAAMVLLARATPVAAAPASPQAPTPAHGATLGALAPHNADCMLPERMAGLCSAPSTSHDAHSEGQAAAGDDAAPGDWSIVSTPDLTGALRDLLSAVTCVDDDDCWAVGEYRTAGDYSRPMADHWDGSSWQLMEPPQPPDILNATLSGVACPSSADCIAAGFYTVSGGGSAPLSEQWNGTSWTLLTTPVPDGEQFGGFRAVACVSDIDCWAVGWSYAADNATLEEQWNGSDWTIATSVPLAAMNAVTCAGSGDCWAVGVTEPDAGAEQPFAAQWNGTSWTSVSAEEPPADTSATLNGVACASATVCWAVGAVQPLFSSSDTPLLEQLSGGSWSMAPGAVPPSGLGELNGVACPAPSSCDAAGYSSSGSGSSPLVELWNGTVWTQSTVDAPASAVQTMLNGVACTADSCWTAGSTQPDDVYITALLYESSGMGWSPTTPPQPIGVNVNALEDVACTGVTYCVSVGSHTDGDDADTLVESWDGNAWTVVPSPSLSGLDSVLLSIACVTSSDCWAVGDAQSADGTSAQPIIESWNGSQWTMANAPAPSGSQVTVLSGVACTAADDCWAVGYSYDGTSTPVIGSAGIAQTLTEQWDGTSWSIVSSPNADPADSAVLESVTCVSASDCWAVGVTAGSVYTGLVEHWDGSQWSVVDSPQTTGSENSGLFGVTCVDAEDCWAVGYSYVSDGTSDNDFQTWVEQWNGSAWTSVGSPNPSPYPVDALFSVSCAASDDCWSVGSWAAPGPDGAIYDTLTLHWDGQAWSWVASPNVTNVGQGLYGVQCVPQAACWSAGNFNDTDGGTLQTLVETTANVPATQVPEAPLTVLLAVLGGASLSAGWLSRRRARPRPRRTPSETGSAGR